MFLIDACSEETECPNIVRRHIAHIHFTLLYEHFTSFTVINSYNYTVMKSHSKCMPQNEFLIARKQVNMAFVQLVNCPVTVQESGILVLIFHPR